MSNSAAALRPAWIGPDHHEARLQEQLARSEGLTVARARVVGHIGSMRDCWAFRRKLADAVGVSVRTVQRAITQAKELGLIDVHRAKENEVPPGAKGPIPCGWSHRWAIARGMGIAAAAAAVAAARVRAAARAATRAVRAMARRGRHERTAHNAESERRRALARQFVEDVQSGREPPD